MLVLSGAREEKLKAPAGSGPETQTIPSSSSPGRDRHLPRDPDQGVDPADPLPVLQLADLGPVERGPPAQLLLGEVFAPADPAQVPAEALGDGDRRDALAGRGRVDLLRPAAAGHADIQTTIDQYGRPDKKAHREAAAWWREAASE